MEYSQPMLVSDDFTQLMSVTYSNTLEPILSFHANTRPIAKQFVTPYIPHRNPIVVTEAGPYLVECVFGLHHKVCKA